MKIEEGTAATSSAPAEGLRMRILHEATRMFADVGFERTSIRELAARCACTKPALYYYFRNKEAVYLEALAIQTERALAHMEWVVSSDGNLRQRLHRGIQRLFDYARVDPDGLRMLHRAPFCGDSLPRAAEQQLASLRELHMKTLQTVFEQGIASGELGRSCSSRDCAIALAGGIDFRLQLWTRGETPSLEGLSSLVDLLFDGMKAP
ncbi:MAG: TetR/AcrR family transcriptional regulator [Nannocystaceae bacterium]